jgi:hypothetical protein
MRRAPDPAARITVTPPALSTSSWNFASALSGVRSRVAARRVVGPVAGYRAAAMMVLPATRGRDGSEGELLPADFLSALRDHEPGLERPLGRGGQDGQQHQQ